ncbi:MAG: hypothetical protein M1419_04100 [Bacteroidetes bacterium]|nr:hypothetical protein [Bacteroidota bacterium]
MPTVQDLVNIYQSYSEKELMDVYSNINNYSYEANEALQIVISNKGGINKLKEKLANELAIENEISKIKMEVAEFIKRGFETNDLKNRYKSSLLTKEQLDSLIEDVKTKIESEKSDKKIKPRTIIGSVIGGVISGTIGGIFWGVQMIYSGHIFAIFGFGIALLSYGTIRFFTKQSKNNIIVLIATMISVIYALVLGEILYELFGYIGEH